MTMAVARPCVECTAADLESLEALARVFGDFYLNGPTDHFMAALVEHDAAATWPALADSTARPQGLEALARALSEWQPGREALRQQEHGALFVGPGPQQAPPWGSIYLSEDKLLMGPSTHDLQHFLDDHGIVYFLREDQPLDHIGLCFGALATMFEVLREAEPGDAQPAQTIVTFLQSHMLPWVRRFLELHLANATSDLQRGMALLAADFFDAAQTVFEVQPDARTLYV